MQATPAGLVKPRSWRSANNALRVSRWPATSTIASGDRVRSEVVPVLPDTLIAATRLVVATVRHLTAVWGTTIPRRYSTP